MLSPSFQRAVRPAINHTRALALVPRAGFRWINLFQRARVVPSPTISPILELRTQFSTKPPLQPNKIDRQHEKEIAQQELEARPGEVSTQSSVRHVIESSQAPPGPERDMTVDIKNDINTIKETFALGAVPRQPYLLGLAGTLPYLATSLSTVFLSWNINTQWPTDSNFLNSILFSNEAATHWLHVLEPLQVGYGAVLISFLGAIHWGMEFAEKQPSHNRTVFRYATGVIAPLVAWPTTLMSIEFALTTQFLAFVSLYFVDSRAMARGWAPTWYQTYRFVLTAIVGAAILISLVSRTKIGASHARLSSPELQDLLSQKPPGGQEYHNWEREEEEERKRLREEKKREEEKKRQEEEKKKKAENKKGKEDGGKTSEGPKDKSGKNNKTEEKNDKKDGGEKQDSGDKQAEEGKQPGGEKKAGEDTKKRDQEDKRDQKDGKQSGKQTSKRDDDQSR